MFHMTFNEAFNLELFICICTELHRDQILNSKPDFPPSESFTVWCWLPKHTNNKHFSIYRQGRGQHLEITFLAHWLEQ